MNCPNCHQSLAANARFCGSCGQRIEALSQARAGAFEPAPAGGAPAATFESFDAQPSGSTAPGLIARAKNIVLAPKAEWPVIAPENTSIGQLYTGYIAPMAAFAAVMGFVHVSLIGVRLPFAGLLRSPVTWGLETAVMTFIMGLIGLFIVALIINGLAPTFGGSRDQRQAMKTAAYSLTPAWLASVLALSPLLPTLLQLLAGCYGIYVLYLGLPVLMRSPRERAAGYTATVVVCCILLGILLGALGATFGHFGMRAGLSGLDPARTHAAQREQGAQTAGNIIGSMLGTDDKGKADLGAALSNLAKAGEASERQAAPTASPGPSSRADQTAQSPASAVGGLLSALGGSLGGANRVEPVDFHTLSNFLPATLGGMKRMNARGEGQAAIGVKTTRAEADYGGEDGASAHVEIADVSGVSGLVDLANGLIQGTTSESDLGYEKNVVIAGRSAHEKYDMRAKRGEIDMILARRFTVNVTGQGVPMSALESAFGQMQLAGLESMKDAGAQSR